MESLQHRRILITGATSGIGKEIALSLIKCDSELLLVGRNEKALHELAGHPERSGSVEIFVTDLGNIREVYGLIKRLKGASKEPDVIIHSAGVFRFAPIDETDDELLNRALTINFMSPYILTREFLGSLVRKRGAVVFINSTVALMPKAKVSAYAASKAALKSFADVLYDEVSSLGVRIASIYPGRVATPMQKRVCEMDGSDYDPGKFIPPETIAQQVIQILTLPDNAEIRELTIRQPR